MEDQVLYEVSQNSLSGFFHSLRRHVLAGGSSPLSYQLKLTTCRIDLYVTYDYDI